MKKILLISILLLAIFGGYYVYDQVFLPNNNKSTENIVLTIPEGASLQSVADILEKNNLIRNKSIFKMVAKKKNYANRVKPGKYKIPPNTSVNDLINMLRLGKAPDVKFTFNNIFSLAQLAGRAGAILEPDSLEFLKALEDETIRNHYGFSKETYPTMFIPNTYSFKWKTSPEDFIKRMAKEYKVFWNGDRTTKREKLKLSTSEVVTLASIVQAEQQADPSEWKTIAGLYLNRVRINMALQSDPTVKFAVGDWSIKRVLNKHTSVESPYNTYKNPGIPPGPILFPDIAAVDAVLDAENHSYLYMCAKADFSGKHEFAKNLTVHNRYAAAYRRALDNKKIYK